MSSPSVEPTAAQLEAVTALAAAERVLLTGHMRPDGDCLGAQAALARVLSARGQEVMILNPDPPEARYDYLSRHVDYAHSNGEKPVPEHDLLVLLDCSEISRCGALAERFTATPSRKMIIDHHILPAQEWWDYAYHDVSAAATGLLVRRIARQLEVQLDEVAAHGIFTSLVTDTGWFKYSNTDSETLAVASEMVSLGLSPHELYSAIYQRRGTEHPHVVAGTLQRLTYHAEGRLALVDLPLPPTGAEDGSAGFESEDLLDLLRAVEAVEVVLFARELEPGSWKLSARSKTDYDVNRLARAFGGGGHAKAAGASLSGSSDEVRSRLVEQALRGFEAEDSGGGEQ